MQLWQHHESVLIPVGRGQRPLAGPIRPPRHRHGELVPAGGDLTLDFKSWRHGLLRGPPNAYPSPPGMDRAVAATSLASHGAAPGATTAAARGPPADETRGFELEPRLHPEAPAWQHHDSDDIHFTTTGT